MGFLFGLFSAGFECKYGGLLVGRVFDRDMECGGKECGGCWVRMVRAWMSSGREQGFG